MSSFPRDVATRGPSTWDAPTGTVEIAAGVHMPRVGFGTYRLCDDAARAAAAAALRCGYRHIDTACIYKNHAEVGRAVAESGVPRGEVFVTSKVSPYDMGRAETAGAVKRAIQELGIGYIDLMLLHWPGVARAAHNSAVHAVRRREAWEALEDAVATCALRSIGVSNFTVRHMEELLSYARIAPAVNQVELHPQFQQKELCTFCARHSVAVVAYSSLGGGALLHDQRVLAAAAAAESTPASVLLRWGLARGAAAVLPKSAAAHRISAAAPEALAAEGLLRASVLAALDGLDEGVKYCWNPDAVL